MGEINFEMGGESSVDDNLVAEFDTHPAAATREMQQSLGTVKEIIGHPDLAGLVKDSRIAEMLDHDLGEGIQLGNSKSIRAALAEAAQKIEHRRSELYGETPLYGRSPVSREQEQAFRRESLSIIKTALMKGRADFIRKTGKPLPGWMS
jgi:hypothetical protein